MTVYDLKTLYFGCKFICDDALQSQEATMLA